MLKPQCIQILAILRLLSVDSPYANIPNQLAQILTGQGKSWVLALIAAFFSMIGYNVTVACYSEYLTKRDMNDFKRYMEPLKTANNVNYMTFESMCSDLVGQNANFPLHQLVKKIISGDKLPELLQNYKAKKSESILLIDEVDVFFTDTFGELYSGCTLIKNKHLGVEQKLIWENMVKGESKKNLQNECLTRLMKNTDDDIMLARLNSADVLQGYLDEMLRCAENVNKNYEDKCCNEIHCNPQKRHLCKKKEEKEKQLALLF